MEGFGAKDIRTWNNGAERNQIDSWKIQKTVEEGLKDNNRTLPNNLTLKCSQGSGLS